MNGKLKAEVFVTLKREVLDPQGDAVRRALTERGFAGVEKVRVGKFIEIELAATTPEDARAELAQMCAKLLANPVIEDFRYELVEA